MNKILVILLLTLPLVGFGQFKHKGKAGLKVDYDSGKIVAPDGQILRMTCKTQSGQSL
jgi:hypothetical protein